MGLSVGPPFVESAESLITSINAIAAVPFKGQPGYQGIGIGTKYPELICCPRQLANVSKVTEWLMGNYPSEIALALMQNKCAARSCFTPPDGPVGRESTEMPLHTR